MHVLGIVENGSEIDRDRRLRRLWGFEPDAQSVWSREPAGRRPSPTMSQASRRRSASCGHCFACLRDDCGALPPEMAAFRASPRPPSPLPAAAPIYLPTAARGSGLTLRARAGSRVWQASASTASTNPSSAAPAAASSRACSSGATTLGRHRMRARCGHPSQSTRATRRRPSRVPPTCSWRARPSPSSTRTWMRTRSSGRPWRGAWPLQAPCTSQHRATSTPRQPRAGRASPRRAARRPKTPTTARRRCPRRCPRARPRPRTSLSALSVSTARSCAPRAAANVAGATRATAVRTSSASSPRTRRSPATRARAPFTIPATWLARPVAHSLHCGATRRQVHQLRRQAQVRRPRLPEAGVRSAHVLAAARARTQPR